VLLGAVIEERPAGGAHALDEVSADCALRHARGFSHLHLAVLASGLQRFREVRRLLPFQPGSRMRLAAVASAEPCHEQEEKRPPRGVGHGGSYWARAGPAQDPPSETHAWARRILVTAGSVLRPSRRSRYNP